VILNYIIAIYLFVIQALIPAVLMLIFALFYTFAAYTWRSRIPFATILLQTVVNVLRMFQGTIAVAIAGLVMQVLYCVLFALTAFGVVFLFNNNSAATCTVDNNGNELCSTSVSGVAYPVYLYCLFSFYWTTQVIKNVVHVTVSGVFGVYYFLYNTSQMPSGSVTLQSLKRATTTSFGSICFGSLIIAVLKLVKAILQQIMYQNNQNAIIAFLACIAACIIGCIDSLIEYFNHYAFTQVAIYGKPFCQAGKDTWTMIKDRGIDAVINDCLVGNVIGIGGFVIGILTTVICYIFIAAYKPAIVSDTGTLVVLLVIAFLIGLSLMSLVGGVIESGTATTFVALGEDPQALARNQPELFEKIRQTWPRIVQGIH